MRQEPEILTAVFDDGDNTVGFSINFTCARGYDEVNEAASIIAKIGDNPTDMVRFNFHAEDRRDYNYYSDGEDAVGIVMEYFNDDLRQEVLRRAAMTTDTSAGESWIRNTSYWDPEWKDTGDDYF